MEMVTKRKLLWALAALALCLRPAAARGGVAAHVAVPSSDELYCVDFDERGLLWMGTSSGIKSYDGFAVRAQYAGGVMACPQLGSDVRSLAIDRDGFLWAGTNDGLVRVHRRSGAVKLYRFPRQSQRIVYALFVSRVGTLYVGTDDGFSVYDRARDGFDHYNIDNATAVMPDGQRRRYMGYGVKDFVETRQGGIVIGTWKQGLWHFQPRTRSIRGYGRLNGSNSAFALCIDRRQRLWIATQGYGVQRIDRADDYRLLTLRTMGEGERNERTKVVYDVAEDADGRMCICTGDTIAARVGPDGALWLATRADGIVRVTRSRGLFANHASGSIRSIFTGNGTHFYLGYGMRGLAWFDARTGELRLNNRVPGYGALPEDGFTTRVTSMVRRWNGEFWAAAGDNGILISHPDGTSEVRYPSSRMPYVRDNVLALYEARDGTLWIGQRQGVSVLLKDGRGMHLDVKNGSLDMTGYFMVNHIAEDRAGNIWISSANGGIVRISGDPSRREALRFRHYALPLPNATACFEDGRRRLWAVVGGRLLRYDGRVDRFEPVGSALHLNGQKVMAINEDRHGALWLATDRALVRLVVDSRGEVSTMSFTEEDGLAGASFLTNATFSLGDTLYFGANGGFVSFVPPAAFAPRSGVSSSLVVTDILVDGSSISDAGLPEVAGVADEHPLFARSVTISPSVRTFGFAFSLLSYANQSEVSYACRLEGHDKAWRYVDGRTHRMLFENVPPGAYRFCLRAVDSRGRWHELPYAVAVRVLPPWYATWWAFAAYACVLSVLCWLVWNYVRMRREVRASRRFSTILQSAQIRVAAGSGRQTAAASRAADADTRGPQGKDAEFVARATQLVREHLEEADYNRDRLASDLGMSVSSLYGRLRQLTGLSTQTYIQTIRLNAACDILRSEPDIRISELAYRVGFNTPKYFSQCFKKEFGVLPGDFRPERDVDTPVRNGV